jgi:hypothetical protein
MPEMRRATHPVHEGADIEVPFMSAFFLSVKVGD